MIYRASSTPEPALLVPMRAFKFPHETWNMLWLSFPELDNGADLTSLSPSAWVHPVNDVEQDKVLRQALALPPGRFLEWFKHEDASIFDSYHHLGEDVWSERVKHRAASIQGATPTTGILRAGNVYHVDFRRTA